MGLGREPRSPGRPFSSWRWGSGLHQARSPSTRGPSPAASRRPSTHVSPQPPKATSWCCTSKEKGTAELCLQVTVVTKPRPPGCRHRQPGARPAKAAAASQPADGWMKKRRSKVTPGFSSGRGRGRGSCPQWFKGQLRFLLFMPE